MIRLHSLSNFVENETLDINIHHFTLTDFGGINLPEIMWDGDYSNKSLQNNTIISIPFLADLVEGIVETLKMSAKDKMLQIQLPGGKRELFQRYILMVVKN